MNIVSYTNIEGILGCTKCTQTLEVTLEVNSVKKKEGEFCGVLIFFLLGANNVTLWIG